MSDGREYLLIIDAPHVQVKEIFTHFIDAFKTYDAAVHLNRS